MDEKKHHGRFAEGFFWGAVIGGAAAYILSHKKGRDFVKELFQDGIDFLEEKAEKVTIDEMLEEQDMMGESVEEPIVEAHVKDYEKIEPEGKEEAIKPQPQKKRFFKKTQKSK